MQRKALAFFLTILIAVVFLSALSLITIAPRSAEDPDQANLTEEQAIQVSRDFLESMNYTIGNALLAQLEEKTPNFFWQERFGLEKPESQQRVLCWIIRFEQPIGHGIYYEVWTDVSTGIIIGGTQIK